MSDEIVQTDSFLHARFSIGHSSMNSLNPALDINTQIRWPFTASPCFVFLYFSNSDFYASTFDYVLYSPNLAYFYSFLYSASSFLVDSLNFCDFIIPHSFW